MYDTGDMLTVTVQGAFSGEDRVVLVRQPDGLYHEIDEPVCAGATATQPDWAREATGRRPQPGHAPTSLDELTATVEGRFGEEHRIRLVRRPNGQYEEVLAPCDVGQL